MATELPLAASRTPRNTWVNFGDASRPKQASTQTLPAQVPDTHLPTLTLHGPEWKEPAQGRLSALVASPRGVMFLVPALVMVVGATLTIVGQLALGATSRTMAQARFVERTASVSVRLEEVLAQSDPILRELTRIAHTAEEAELRHAATRTEDPTITTIGLEMRDLLIGRKAISQAYVAFADGRFLSVDPGGPTAVGFQITRHGVSKIYRVERQSLLLEKTSVSNYDPRTRDWFRLALAQKASVWSEPYAFFFNQHPGVTRALPVYSGPENAHVLAVVGVDIDVNALTHFMASGETSEASGHSVVFTLGGVILAYPQGAEKLRLLPKSEQVATHQALDEPEISALVEYVQVLPERKRTQATVQFEADGTKMLASVRKVGAGGPDWYVATFAPEAAVLAELYSHRQRSLGIGGLALAFSMALAWLLARHILRVRKMADDARVLVQRAREQVLDLGSYRLLSRIGEGGMGEVWRARHRLLAREAAIKLIKSTSNDAARDAEQRERFRREAQAIASLRSRHTVALFDYGVTPSGTMFYVMELLDGIDLNTLVKKHGAQPAERVRLILIQACKSLAEAHAAQLVHRDIKPANLFLCREAEEVDVVKVLDFGLVFQQGSEDVVASPAALESGEASLSATWISADPSGRITRPNRQLGTPAFMSPEQALGHETDARSDIYSLACVAWWLLTARTPFEAPTQLAMMVQQIETVPAPLAPLTPQGISSAFEAILLECLAKSPNQRPQSAQGLEHRLRDLGPQVPEWTLQQATLWWNTQMPERPQVSPDLRFSPLHEMALVAPSQTDSPPQTPTGSRQ